MRRGRVGGKYILGARERGVRERDEPTERRRSVRVRMGEEAKVRGSKSSGSGEVREQGASRGG